VAGCEEMARGAFSDALARGCRCGAIALVVAWGTVVISISRLSADACATEPAAMLCIASASEAKAAGSRLAMVRASEAWSSGRREKKSASM
jgi:hypothetical protein